MMTTQKQLRDEYAEWLQQYPLNVAMTVTWSDKYAADRFIYTDRAAAKDVRRFLNEAGYQGLYFGVIEDHRDRSVPHVHMLIEDKGSMRRLNSLWTAKRGMLRTGVATPDAVRYVVKHIDDDGRLGERILLGL